MRNILFAAAIAASFGAAGAASAAEFGADQSQGQPTYFHGGRSAPADFTDVNRYEAQATSVDPSQREDDGSFIASRSHGHP